MYNGQGWVYVDNNNPADIDRPCAKCGRMPTPEGHDACLGNIAGVSAACCGHGMSERIIIHGTQKVLPASRL